MRIFKKTSPETKVFLLFFSFLLFFTLARGPIGSLDTALLTLTGEMPSPDSCGEQGQPSGGTRVVSGRRQKAKRKRIPDKPTTTKLPKTKTPVVAWCDTLSVSVAHAPDFPPLRKYDGTRWTKEKTVIKAVSDGTRIKFQFHLFDSNPDEAVTTHSRSNPSNAWQDDGIEFFLMKDRDAKIYCQYAMSVIGRGSVFMLKCNKKNMAGGSRMATPDAFIPPLMSARRTSDGFLMELTVNLRNVGIDSLEPGDSFLIQIARNFRGQRNKDSVILQLFPTHIYADNRHGANNHHRKSFQPVKIINSSELAKHASQ